MKRFAILAALMVVGLVAVPAAEAHPPTTRGYGYGSYGSSGYGFRGGNSYGHNHFGGYTARWGGYDRGYGVGYGIGFPGYRPSVYHDTSHYDYHPTQVVPHGNHYHVVPGHYHFHQQGHWHR